MSDLLTLHLTLLCLLFFFFEVEGLLLCLLARCFFGFVRIARSDLTQLQVG